MTEEEKKDNSPSTGASPQQEEQLNTPSTDEPIATSIEQGAEVESQTTNLKPETQEMEVHHHTHHEHGKRNWKSYFWEFLMLFLAVFCGFLAEYQLEHKIERDRTREYASLLIKDLEKDTIQINNVVNQLEEISRCIDSISIFVHNGISGNKVPGSFYYHSQIGTLSPIMIWNDATLIQLTQSGNLRYFRDQELVNKISSYYSNQDYIRYLTNGDRERRETSIAIRSRILNNYYYKDYSTVLPLGKVKLQSDKLMKNMIPVQSNDAQLLNEYANSFENRRGYINLVLTDTYPKAKANANELILILKKEYHLE
jgi:hypothetical protein